MTKKEFTRDVICPKCGKIIKAGSLCCEHCGITMSDAEEAAFKPVENIIEGVYGPPINNGFMGFMR